MKVQVVPGDWCVTHFSQAQVRDGSAVPVASCYECGERESVCVLSTLSVLKPWLELKEW